MATCLRCDNCGATATEKDEEIHRWWTVRRYGENWIPEPGKPVEKVQVLSMPTIFITEGMDEEDLDDEEMEELIFSSPSMLEEVILHFCKASCLGAWAVEAGALEP